MDSPAQLAKAALRRLALDRLEPTPENYARAYAQEGGMRLPPAAGAVQAPAPESTIKGRDLAQLIERIARGLERGGRTWTTGRKKDSLQRVLDGSRADAQRLVAERERQHFRSVADATKLVPAATFDLTAASVDTQYFEVRGRLRVAA